MTAIFYPDREATSASGRFTLEARSPHNGTIHHRDGRAPSEEEYAFRYRDHQSEFRYRLLDRDRGHAPRVVWERWQQPSEDSPSELLVSDGGWSVIRTHGFRPEVIAVSPFGTDAVRVTLARPDETPSESIEAPGATSIWALTHLSWTTAGSYWAGNSWRYFLTHGGEPYFAWRTYWGQRLVIDFTREIAFTDERQQPAELKAALDAAAKTEVTKFLRRLSQSAGGIRSLLSESTKGGVGRGSPREQLWRVPAALHLVGIHLLRECIPFLREWEAIDYHSYSTGSTAMRRRQSREGQYFRPVAHHALKRLGEEPRGFATYHFTSDSSEKRLSIPECLPDRRLRAQRLSREMSEEEVLTLLGSPDFIGRQSWRVEGVYEWSESWEYDFREGNSWVTLRIAWQDGNDGGRIVGIEEIAPYWLNTDERESEFLRI